MKGQRIVVIGGTAGMGLAIAEAAVAAGATVIVASRTQARVDAAVGALGIEEGVAIDIGDETAVGALFQRLGPVDHVVVTANAAATVPGAIQPVSDIDLAAAERFMRTKFWGPYHVARHAPKTLREGGSLLFFSGAAARRSLPNHTAIAATNGAVEAFAKQLAKEIAPIRVNVISPGLVDTSAYDAIPEARRNEMYAAAGASLPVGRIGTVQDIADAALFALGNRFLTGAVLDVDGGRQVL
ncbi:MAG: SDR family oxidoreductase [Rhodospirillaceae bacterium]|nr:SDR family oxidoreductase [Rhodospirillaceae bacterium]MYH36495.1 SDR family oxidoreductase [Rhodospirillaceae bacterium]MYK14710.1 SDR family oxidoreductase [Rhodospirillaceae bacterium]MYK59298.1 SDR family oxidoreductase [Rhodospirillaceae bacterium]